MANKLGLELPFATSVTEQYKTPMNNGFGEEHVSALYQVKIKANKYLINVEI